MHKLWCQHGTTSLSSDTRARNIDAGQMHLSTQSNTRAGPRKARYCWPQTMRVDIGESIAKWRARMHKRSFSAYIRRVYSLGGQRYGATNNYQGLLCNCMGYYIDQFHKLAQYLWFTPKQFDELEPYAYDVGCEVNLYEKLLYAGCSYRSD